MTYLTVVPGGMAAMFAQDALERASAAARRREWGSPVTKAVCDHLPVRIRLYDVRNHEIGVVYHECRHCAVPLFLDDTGRVSQVYRAEECGCVYPGTVCTYHGGVSP